MKILVGISGGVDSAAAALKLKNEGHTVECALLKMHEFTDVSGARAVAGALGLVLHEIDMTKAFERSVKENLIDEYSRGRTPNPCIICNREVKFRGLYDFARENGFDGIATGHYAKIICNNGRYSVATAGDIKKDQSYMLYRLPEDILSMLILPLSDAEKSDVRELVRGSGLAAADAKDSQEICFLPDNDYPAFIESVRGEFPEGNFIDTEGNILGRHKGIIRYTVGQRKGLGIALGARAFVTDISPENNTVTLSKEFIGKREISLSGVVFSGMERPPAGKYAFTVKLRYSAPKIPTVAEFSDDGSVRLYFDSPVTAAAGQSAVVYDGERVLFGGFIERDCVI